MRKINVLYISNQGGGAPKSLLNMIHSLEKYVNPIVLFENDWYDYQAFVKKGIRCIIVPYRMNMILNEPGYKTLKYKIHRFADECLKNKLAAYKVAKILGNEKIEIVHTNTGAITIGNAIAKVLGAKFVWHLREFQDIDFGGHPYCGWKKFYRLMDDADAVIGITHAIGRHFHFDKHKNAHVVWDAVRSAQEVVVEKGKDDYILYCSATIAPAKGLHDLIEAFGISDLPRMGIKLIVLGNMDEKYKPTIDKLIYQYKLGTCISFEGGKSDVKPFFTKAKAFVLPSLNEGLGRVVVEAMMYGCPVIARKTGGPTEYIIHGENGYFFSNNVELSSLLNKTVVEDQLPLIKTAQRFAVENFSEEVYGEKILKIYREIL